jgi:hypothetical protein
MGELSGAFSGRTCGGDFVESIMDQGALLAIILRTSFHSDGIHFFTPNDFSQQLGYMNRQAGYVISPHVHNPVVRQVHFTKEVLYIKSGRVRIDFYSEDQRYLHSKILNKGDVILLAFGGHGFEILEDAEIIEVKQGPYAGERDKTRFLPVSTDQLIFRD